MKTQTVAVAMPITAPEPTVKIMLTVREAAQALSVSEQFMWKLVGRKIIPSVKVGRSRRVRVSALESYAEALADDDVA